MRAFSVVCLVLVLFVAILVGVNGNPVGDDNIVALEAADQPLSLFEVDGQQGHENEGDRLARHHGYGGYGGYYGGGHRGAYGHGGGYGGYRGGYGHGGGYGGHHGGYYG